MSESRTLSQAFETGLAGREIEHPRSGAELEAALRRDFDEATSTWPSFDLPMKDFAEHCGDCVGRTGCALDELRVSDLFVARACATGQSAAIGHFESKYFGDLRAAISQIDKSASFRDEVLQRVRVRLFTGDEPKILSYSGRGDLYSWTRVVAMRIAYKMKRADKRNVEVDDNVLADLEHDPELEGLKQKYQAQFKAALAAALAELEPMQRTILRLTLVDGLPAHSIGTIHNVHRTTVARWLSEIRHRLDESTRQHLRANLKLAAEDELDSIFRLISSRLDVSIRTHLKSRVGSKE